MFKSCYYIAIKCCQVFFNTWNPNVVFKCVYQTIWPCCQFWRDGCLQCVFINLLPILYSIINGSPYPHKKGWHCLQLFWEYKSPWLRFFFFFWSFSFVFFCFLFYVFFFFFFFWPLLYFAISLWFIKYPPISMTSVIHMQGVVH